MAYEDYSHAEIDTICSELLSLHGDKLKCEEVVFINKMFHVNLHNQIAQEDRDTLIGMYDRLRGED